MTNGSGRRTAQAPGSPTHHANRSTDPSIIHDPCTEGSETHRYGPNAGGLGVSRAYLRLNQSRAGARRSRCWCNDCCNIIATTPRCGHHVQHTTTLFKTAPPSRSAPRSLRRCSRSNKPMRPRPPMGTLPPTCSTIRPPLLLRAPTRSCCRGLSARTTTTSSRRRWAGSSSPMEGTARSCTAPRRSPS